MIFLFFIVEYDTLEVLFVEMSITVVFVKQFVQCSKLKLMIENGTL